MVKFMCDSPKVYVRNCLTTPFIIAPQGEIDVDIDEAEKFMQEKTEIFILTLCLMI
jgi:hypothetical protein